MIVLVLMISSMTISPVTSGSSPYRGNESRAYNAYLLIESDTELETAAAENGWKGNGSSSNPFIIEDMDINGSGYQYGVRIQQVDHHFIMRNNTIHDVVFKNPTYLASGGIFLWDTPNAVIEGNEIRNNTECGLFVSWTKARIVNNTFIDNRHDIHSERGNVTIEGNNFTYYKENLRGSDCEYGAAIVRNNTWVDHHNDVGALSLAHLDHYVVEGNTFKNVHGGIYAGGEYGRRPPGSVDVIANNTIEGQLTGIGLSKTHDVLVKNNTVTSEYRGIRIDGVDNCTFEDNTFRGVGFYSEGAFGPGNIIDGSNTVLGNPVKYLRDADGLDITEDFGQLILYNCTNISLVDRVLDNRCSGFLILKTTDTLISNITIGNTIRSSLYLFTSDNVTYEGNDGPNQARCYLLRSNNVSLEGNRFNGSLLQVYYGTNTNFINNSYLSSPKFGPVILALEDSRIVGNTISVTNRNEHSYGLRLQRCLRLEIKNNSLTGEGMRFIRTGNVEGWTSHDIDDSNTFEGRPILFRKDTHGVRITGKPGQVILVNCTAFDVSGCTLWNGSFGITVAFTSYGNITFTQMRDVRYPSIWLFKTYGVLIANNELSGGNGIAIEESPFTNVVGNVITGSGPWRGGISVGDSRNVTVINNMFKNLSRAIYYLSDSLYGKITNNHVENSTSHGLSIKGDYNSIHHNNFIGNNRSATSGNHEGPQCQDIRSTNTWTNGTEGNYWSDYMGQYPDATNDGTIWNQPYVLDGLGSDPHPLVNESGLLPLNITADGTIIDQGGTAELSAEVADVVGFYNISWMTSYDGENVTQYGHDFEHTFDIPGYYMVNVTLRDGTGRSTWILVNVTVRDTVFPVADAGDDIVIDQGQTVELNGSGSYDNARITRWLWTVQHPTGSLTFPTPVVDLTYNEAGVFHVGLAVWDEFDNSATDSIMITVRDTVGPTAVAGDDIVIDQGGTVELNGTGSSDRVGISRWSWTVEHPDGNLTFTTPTVNLTYNEAGVFVATLTVWDRANNVGSDSVTITVRDIEPPEVVLGGPIQAFPGDLVELNASGSSDNVGIASWVWTFEYDGHMRNLEGHTQSWKFDIKGEYDVTLTLTDAAGNEASGVLHIKVGEDVPPIAVTGNDVTIEPGETVILDGSASTDDVGIVTWEWTFEYDGEPQNLPGSVVEFMFGKSGLYTVTLTVWDLSGNNGSATMRVVVVDTESPVAVAGEDLHVDLGETVEFDGSGSVDKVGIVSYEWTFVYDGGTVSLEDMRPSHTFEIVGTYEVTLTVMDGNDNSDSTTQRIIVHDNVPPVATIMGPENVTVGELAILDGSTSHDNIAIVNWTWTIVLEEVTITLYGDSAEYTFERSGNYTVSVRVQDEEGLGATDTYVIRVTEVDDGNGGNGGNGTDGDDDDPMRLFTGVLVASVILVVLVILLVTLRKRSIERAEDPEER
jgi:parallel beta-helix repeat protein